ncbi:STAS domain-containing protein [Nocardia sp. NPDC056000]|uniref:STAS domain-containing protein n=1 Tax=Nocardia sp. NPDC056000 TaxID=3345674 RepID=UPI0035D782AB
MVSSDASIETGAGVVNPSPNGVNRTNVEGNSLMNAPDQLLRVRLDDDAANPVVTVSGEIDVTSAPMLERVLRQALATNPRTVVVDMAGVSFLGSAGITVLAAAAQQCRELPRVVASYPVRRPLEITGADTLFVLCDNLDTALAAAGS